MIARYHPAPAGVRLLEREPAGAGPTLMCFPSAGGSASLFRPLMAALPQGWRMIAFDPPGHGTNGGKPFDRIEVMVDAYLPIVEELARGPYYLVGHSLGGLVAYLLARSLERGRSPPSGVLLSSAGSPIRGFGPPLSRLDDAALLARLAEIGGVTGVLLERPEALRDSLPAVRADFLALERYVHHHSPPLGVPLWALAGTEDPFVPVESVADWCTLAASSQLRLLSGGHALVQTHPVSVARALVELAARAEGAGDLEQLAAGDVHVWWEDPDQAADLSAQRGALSPLELARAARFIDERARRQHVVSRALLRRTLSRYVRRPPSSWSVEPDAYGRPRLTDTAGLPRIDLNLSHTDGCAAVALGCHEAIGLDVEALERRRPLELGGWLAPEEASALAGLPASARQVRALEHWTIKEAYLKARGTGLSLPMDQVRVDLSERGAPQVHFAPGLAEDPCRWRFVQVRSSARHLMALAVRTAASAPMPAIILRGPTV